jgi:hypothetical protein
MCVASGLDFLAKNPSTGRGVYKWTQTLCLADSDGDGQSNGQELGDPCCTTNCSGVLMFTLLAATRPVQQVNGPRAACRSDKR